METPGYTLRFNGAVIESGTRAHCIAKRQLNGDLLFGPDGHVDPGDDWLWPWEMSVDSYARRQQMGDGHGV